MEPDPWRAVERIGRSFPDTVAVLDADPARMLTYRDLVTAAEHRSAELAIAGVRAGGRVGVAVRRSGRELIAVLAVLRLGAAVVALEPSAPPRYSAALLDLAGVRVVIGDTGRLAALDEIMRDRVALPIGQACAADVPPAAPVDEAATAWLGFTPAATGWPRPLPVSRAEVISHAVDLDPRGARRYLRLAPLAHQGALVEMFRPLLHAGVCHIYPVGAVTPDGLAEFVAARGITGLWLPGRIVRQVADYRPDAFGSVHEVLVGDEPMPDVVTARLSAACPGLELAHRPADHVAHWVRGVPVDVEYLGEVLRRHPEVRDAMVAAVAGDRLLAGVVAANLPPPSAALTAHAAEYLPAAAVPTLWAHVDELPPRTDNGIARLLETATANDPVRRAARIQRRRVRDSRERSTLELAVRLSWEEVLGISDFERHDEFFEVGGNSVGMLRLRGSLRRRLPDLNVTVQDLYRYPTVASLVDHLASGTRP